METKQIAMKHFRGGNGTFAEALAELRAAVEAADRALAAAEEYLLPDGSIITHDPTSRAHLDWAEDTRWAMALTRQALETGIRPVECHTTFGKCEYEVGSGLRFFWDRWESDPGYTFGVIHPTGRFTGRSKLRLALEEAGWSVNSYGPDGQFLRKERPLTVAEGRLIEWCPEDSDEARLAAGLKGDWLVSWSTVPVGDEPDPKIAFRAEEAEKYLRPLEAALAEIRGVEAVVSGTALPPEVESGENVAVKIDRRAYAIARQSGELSAFALRGDCRNMTSATIESEIVRMRSIIDLIKSAEEVSFETLLRLMDLMRKTPRKFCAWDGRDKYFNLAFRGKVYEVSVGSYREGGEFEVRRDCQVFELQPDGKPFSVRVR